MSAVGQSLNSFAAVKLTFFAVVLMSNSLVLEVVAVYVLQLLLVTHLVTVQHSVTSSIGHNLVMCFSKFVSSFSHAVLLHAATNYQDEEKIVHNLDRCTGIRAAHPPVLSDESGKFHRFVRSTLQMATGVAHHVHCLVLTARDEEKAGCSCIFYSDSDNDEEHSCL